MQRLALLSWIIDTTGNTTMPYHLPLTSKHLKEEYFTMLLCAFSKLEISSYTDLKTSKTQDS